MIAAALMMVGAELAQGGGALSPLAAQRRKDEAALVYAQQADRTRQEFQQKQAFRERVERERGEFDRAAAVNRQNMLAALEGMAPEDRRLAYERFSDAERAKRRDFDRQLNGERQAFNRLLREQRQDSQRALKRRRRELRGESPPGPRR